MKRLSSLSRMMTLAGMALLGPVPALAATFTVTNTNDSGAGSLRAAMTSANATAGTDTIAFNIPGTGVQTLVVLSTLPIVTDTVIIDGTTQPGYAGVPRILLDGAVAGGAAFRFSAPNNVLRAVTLSRFATGAIFLVGGGGNTISGCYIGTDATGRLARGNGTGITILSSNNFIGGSTAATRNVISANDADAITVSASSGNTFLGNFIGVDATGVAPLGNAGSGIRLVGSALTGIGFNVIAGNAAHGVSLESGSNSSLLVGNALGTDYLGSVPMGNGGNGVFIQNTSGTQVGTVTPGQGNRIAFNGGAGVAIVGATSLRNSVRGNSSNANLGTGRGIDLGNDGPTSNDLLDPDTGPNTLQNSPDITAVVSLPGTTQLLGTMSSTPSRSFTIDFYRSPSCLSGVLGETNKTWLGSTTATTSALGLGLYFFNTPTVLPVGSGVTAVATDASGNSSEYNLCATVL